MPSSGEYTRTFALSFGIGLSATLLLGSCATEPDVCEQAIALVEECTGEVEEYPAEGCIGSDARDAEEVLANGCPAGGGKSDLWGKGVNDRCTFNLQCGADLVCRPVNSATSFRDKFCLPHGEETGTDPKGKYCGDFCDVDGDCALGSQCKDGTYPLLGAPMCVRADHAAGWEDACNPLQNVYGAQGDVCPVAAEKLQGCLGTKELAQFLDDCQRAPASPPDSVVIDASKACPGGQLWEECGFLAGDCAGALVCRPTGPKDATRTLCLPIGRDIGKPNDFADGFCGGFCDDDSDCAPATYCIGDNTVVNGMCLVPGHGRGNHYQCQDHLPWVVK